MIALRWKLYLLLSKYLVNGAAAGRGRWQGRGRGRGTWLLKQVALSPAVSSAVGISLAPSRVAGNMLPYLPEEPGLVQLLNRCWMWRGQESAGSGQG